MGTRSLNKWQQLNLRGGSGTVTATTTPLFTVAVFTAVSEMTVAIPSDWPGTLPDVTVYDSTGIIVNQNRYTVHVATDHVRITIRPAGDYTVKLSA